MALGTTEVSKMTGASYRMLDHWCRTGRIPGQPVDGRGVGSGHRREWTDEQVERVMLLVRASELVNMTLDEAVELLLLEGRLADA